MLTLSPAVFLWGLLALPLVGAPMVYLIGQSDRRRVDWAGGLSWLLVGAVGVVYLILLRQWTAGVVPTFRLGEVTVTLDGVGLLVGGLALELGLLVLLVTRESAALVLLLLGTIIGLCCTRDLFNLWVWFETLAVTSYLLVAFDRERPDALAACVKYLLQTAAGSVLVVFGIALVLAQTGSLDMEVIAAHIQPTPPIFLAAALLVIGFGVKVALVPTYTWLPDAYAAAPSGISALLAGVVTVTGLVALVRGLALFAGVIESWGALLLLYGTLNVVIGSILAFGQREVKRLLAYSSVVHVGLIVIGLGIGIQTGTLPGYYGALLHLFIHGLMKALAFLAVGVLIFSLGRDRHLTTDDLRGALYRCPLAAGALIVALFSLAGLPPLAGFISKWQLLRAAMLAQDGLMTAAALVMAAASAFSFAYYLPVVNALFRRADDPLPSQPMLVSMQVVLLVLLVGVVGLGLMPGLLDPLISAASLELQMAFR